MVKTKHILIALAVIGANVLLNMPVHKAFAATPYDYWYGTTGGFVYIPPAPAVISGVNLTIDDTTCNIDDEPKHANLVSKSIYGGYTSGNDTVSNNSLTIALNSIPVAANIYAGYSSGGEASGNKLIINSGTINGSDKSVYGGFSNDSLGKVSNNEVTINGGTINNNVYGGNGGSVNSNKVTITGGAISGVVQGGCAYGDVIGNEVTIKKGTISGYVYGGSSISGDATDNSITIEGGTFNNVKLYGGSCGGGKTSSGNTLNLKTVINGTIKEVADIQNVNFTIPAGMDREMTMLKVTTTPMELAGVTFNVQNWSNGDYITLVSGVNGTEGALAGHTNFYVLDIGGTKELVYSNGTPTAKGDYTIKQGSNKFESNITGSHSEQINGNTTDGGLSDTSYSGNEIIIRRGTYDSTTAVAGAYNTTTADAISNNTVKIYDGTLKGIIYGGYSINGAVSGNKVNIYGGTLGESNTISIYGGWSNGSNATGNLTNIEGGTFASGTYIRGGGSNSGNAIGNTLIIKGGTFSGASNNFYGGESNNGNAGGNSKEEGNTLNIIGGTFGDSSNFYGGKSSFGKALYNRYITV